MRLTIATLLAGIALAGAAGPGAAQEGQPSSAIEVKPNTPALSTRELLERVTPVISVYAVDPKASDCKGEDCGPVARFFVLNRSLGGTRAISVECSASGPGNESVAQASTTVQVPSSQAVAAAALFRGADISRFAKVACSIAGQ